MIKEGNIGKLVFLLCYQGDYCCSFMIFILN